MDPFNPHTAGAWRYPPRKAEVPKGLLLARAIARAVVIAGFIVWLGLMLTQAIEKAAHDIKQAEKVSALYAEGY
jgi:hypothetical protein